MHIFCTIYCNLLVMLLLLSVLHWLRDELFVSHHMSKLLWLSLDQGPFVYTVLEPGPSLLLYVPVLGAYVVLCSARFSWQAWLCGGGKCSTLVEDGLFISLYGLGQSLPHKLAFSVELGPKSLY